MGKVGVPISQVLPIQWVFLHFPVLWEIDGNTHALPIWWSIPQDGSQMGKKNPHYGRSVITNFPGFPHTMGFVVFSRTMEIDGKTREFPISWDSLIFSCVTWVCMTILITHICIWTEKTSKVRSKARLQEMLWIYVILVVILVKMIRKVTINEYICWW